MDMKLADFWSWFKYLNKNVTCCHCLKLNTQKNRLTAQAQPTINMINISNCAFIIIIIYKLSGMPYFHCPSTLSDSITIL